MKLGEIISDTGLRMAALGRLLEAGSIDIEGLRAALAPCVDRVRANEKYLEHRLDPKQVWP